MLGEQISEEDERAYEALKEFGEPAIEITSLPLFRWFKHIKEYHGTNDAQCSFCQKPIVISMMKFAIATSKSPDPVFNCSGCKDYEDKLSFFEDCLKTTRYIHGDTLTNKELETFQKILRPLVSVVERCRNSYPNLTSYILRLEELSTDVTGATCLACAKKFNYLKYENLVYGIKAESPFCNDCYYNKGLEKLVKAGRTLGENACFFGFNHENIKRETDYFNQLKDFEPLAKHCLYPSLELWFTTIKANKWDPIVKCDGCSKDFANNSQAFMEIKGNRYYACSGKCKEQVGMKARRKDKEQDKFEKIKERLNVNVVEGRDVIDPEST